MSFAPRLSPSGPFQAGGFDPLAASFIYVTGPTDNGRIIVTPQLNEPGYTVIDGSDIRPVANGLYELTGTIMLTADSNEAPPSTYGIGLYGVDSEGILNGSRMFTANIPANPFAQFLTGASVLLRVSDFAETVFYTLNQFTFPGTSSGCLNIKRVGI